MSHSNPDCAAEERIKAKLAEAGVREAAFDEFITETRDGYFSEESLASWLTHRRETRPHRFIDNGEQIDAALIAKAAAGNITARAQLFVRLGKDQAAVDQLLAAERAKAKPVTIKHNGRTNPWSAEGWSVTRQGALIREIGLAAATSIAASAGSFIGATKPAKAA